MKAKRNSISNDIVNIYRNVTRAEIALMLFRASKNDDKTTATTKPKVVIASKTASKDVIEKFETSTDTPKVSLSFEVPMDKDSVESNITIYPDVKTKLEWKGSKALEIEILDEIEKELDLLVNVDKEAKDLEGNSLDTPVVKKFRVDGTAKIDFVSPT